MTNYTVGVRALAYWIGPTREREAVCRLKRNEPGFTPARAVLFSPLAGSRARRDRAGRPILGRLFGVLVEVNVLIDPRHPAQRDHVVKPVGTAALGQLDR